jgi:hypothetical protein
MPIWSPSSRRCFVPEATLALTAAVVVLLSLAPTTARAAIPRTPVEAALRRDLASPRPDGSFAGLLRRWETLYRSEAIPPLARIAADRSRPDHERFIAVMGIARLGGPAAAERITPFLKEPSWMLRQGALRALTALRPESPAVARATLPLLRDRALVVRSAAVDAVRALRPPGAEAALIEALRSPANYRAGRGLWVPAKALEALVELNATDRAGQLKPLLGHERDPELQRRAIAALESLTGRRLKPTAPLAERVKAWRAENL